jgi:hypothetical protein
MRVETINGKTYKLPGSLSKFQKELYVHLINYKWKHVTTDVGLYNYKGNLIEYDAILPKKVRAEFPLIYKSVLKDMQQHLKKYPFKLHIHFNHVASSQVANINLFLPILLSSKSNEILRLLKPDFKELAVNKLYKGFRIEYWDGNSNENKGLLGDHNANSGTDSDIAIAYYNQKDELCLWLIEHKLTEKEFTVCGGYKSNGRDKSKHLCNKSFNDILDNKDLCYYHNVKKNNYWKITEKHKIFFVNNDCIESCPFQKGMNQLWRNQLLGLAIEDDENNDFKNVYFSVVHHPDNHHLDKSINDYKSLVANNPKFSSFTAKDVIDNAIKVKDKEIEEWVEWYRELYKV